MPRKVPRGFQFTEESPHYIWELVTFAMSVMFREGPGFLRENREKVVLSWVCCPFMTPSMRCADSFNYRQYLKR